VIGPWAAGNEVRGRRRGRRRGVQLRALIDFFERELRGGATVSSPVRVFTFGEERWRELFEWPPAGASDSTWHLRADREDGLPIDDGGLSPEAPATDEAPKRFRADPEDPVPSVGGMSAAAPGPVDQRCVEARADVLCYASPPLERDVVVAGPARVQLHVVSNGADGDFTAKLVDVSEDGSAVIVCDGIIRARTCSHGRGEAWFEGDSPRRLEIPLPAIARRFVAGHRIRLEIAASSFPRFDRNPQAHACPQNACPDAFTAAQVEVLHDAEHPSRLTLTTIAN